jgi:hypothetical protein
LEATPAGDLTGPGDEPDPGDAPFPLSGDAGRAHTAAGIYFVPRNHTLTPKIFVAIARRAR